MTRPARTRAGNDDGSAAFVTLTTTMAAAMPYISDDLVGRGARAALRRVTDRLPAALTQRTYLECRLNAASRVDFIACIDDASRLLLMERHRTWLPCDLRTHPLWEGLARLCSEWADPRSTAGAWIHDVWLEFDLQGGSDRQATLIPNVFIGLRRRSTSNGQVFFDAALTCLEILQGEPVAAYVAAAASVAAARIPPGMRIPYVGLMYPRNREAVRLCVTPLAGRVLADYLNAIEWPGSTGELASWLSTVPCGDATALDSTTLLHVDVADRVQAAIGLEIPLQQHRQVVGALAERSLLDWLCGSRLCAEAKRDALMCWPGYSIRRFAHQCWPSLALRRVSHVKVIYQPGHGVELKTYLSFFHAFSRRYLQTRKPLGNDEHRRCHDCDN